MSALIVNDYFLQVPCLDSAECIRAGKLVERIRSNWISRYKLHTVGTTTHMDWRHGPPEPSVVEEMNRSNLLIRGCFAFVFTKIKSELESLLNAPVKLVDWIPVPGCMIYNGPVVGKIEDRSHIDLQFELHDWSRFKDIDFSNPITFTLPIRLPSYSSGVKFWPRRVHSKYSEEHQIDQFIKFVDPGVERFVPYKVGMMVVHPGTYLHAIENDEAGIDETPRITLQGHALLCDGVWRLYW